MKHWKTGLKVAVSLGLVAWLIERVDWPTVRHILQGVYLPFIGAYIALQIVGNMISAAKWRYLASLQGTESFSLRDGFFAYLTGAFINNFLPSTVGGDTYRVLWMSRTGARASAFAVVFFDRITGLAALFLFSALGLALLPWQLLLEKPGFIILTAIVLSGSIVIISGLFLIRKYFEIVTALLRQLPWPRILMVANQFQSFAEYRPYALALGWASLFTLVGIGGSNYFLFQSIGAELSVISFLSAIFIATLVANIPISINNIGVKEWAYVFFFGLVGVSAEVAVTAALLSRLLQMLISFLALPQYLKEKKVTVVTAPPLTSR
ncbi:MAG: lysylphosphatidylglycerol synthase transmembrane domain-containing protein [Undibacterium sp.]